MKRSYLFGAAILFIGAIGVGSSHFIKNSMRSDLTDVHLGLIGNIPFISGGTGSKHAVVFFGGSALFKRLDQSSNPKRYAEQIQALLPSDYRFTILGYEETPPRDYTVSGIAQSYADLIRAKFGKPDLIIGVSFGGFVAGRLAAQHPDLVNRLVLLVSGSRFSEAGWSAMQRQFKALEERDFYTLARDNILLFRRPWYNWLIQLKLYLNREQLASEFKDAHEILRAYRSLFAGDFGITRHIAAQIAAPTLVIGGSADQFFGAEQFEETGAWIPQATVDIFEKETHMLPLERSADVKTSIIRFLAGRSPPAP